MKKGAITSVFKESPPLNSALSRTRHYGVYLYLVFVWLSLVVIAWVLGGGLRRRRSQGNSATIIPGIIFTTRPPKQSPPPIIIADVDPAQNDDNEIMDEP